MPSEKILQEKQSVVSNLSDKLKNAVSGVLVDYKGISVAEDTKLRKDLREAGVVYSVEKNTMISLAIKDTALADISSVLEGTTALAISMDDAMAPARILGKYAENSKGKFSIKIGFIDGAVCSAEDVVALSKLPSREVLIAQVLGGFNAPITKLACVIKAIAEKQPA